MATCFLPSLPSSCRRSSWPPQTVRYCLLCRANEAKPSAAARRMAVIMAGGGSRAGGTRPRGAAMTVTTPTIHGDPIWPWPIRLRSTRCLMCSYTESFAAAERARAGGLWTCACGCRIPRAPPARTPDRIVFRPGRRRRGDRPAAIDVSALSAIHGKRPDQSWPLRVSRRTRFASRSRQRRYPSS